MLVLNLSVVASQVAEAVSDDNRAAHRRITLLGEMLYLCVVLIALSVSLARCDCWLCGKSTQRITVVDQLCG